MVVYKFRYPAVARDKNAFTKSISKQFSGEKKAYRDCTAIPQRTSTVDFPRKPRKLEKDPCGGSFLFGPKKGGKQHDHDNNTRFLTQTVEKKVKKRRKKQDRNCVAMSRTTKPQDGVHLDLHREGLCCMNGFVYESRCLAFIGKRAPFT